MVAEKFGPEHPIPLIVSKIESQEALDNWDEILQESDGIMVPTMVSGAAGGAREEGRSSQG